MMLRINFKILHIITVFQNHSKVMKNDSFFKYFFFKVYKLIINDGASISKWPKIWDNVLDYKSGPVYAALS